MKKTVICTVLMITYLIHGFSVFVYAEEAGANEEKQISITEDTNYQAFKWLDMTSSDMDKLYLDSHISRGQFAYVLASILGYRSNGVAYSDIADAQDTIYAGAIDYLVKGKIMQTMPVNKFNPKDDILYKEIITATVTALGYMDIKDSKQDADTYAKKIAAQIGLTKGITSNYNAALSAKDTFMFLKRAALTSVCEIDGVSKKGVNYTNKGGKSLIYVYSQISYSEGVVTANGITAINGENVLDDHAKIGDITVSTKKFHGIEKLIGRRVEFFYEDKGSNYNLRYANVSEKKNDIVTISAEQLESYSPDFSINQIIYHDKSKTKKIKISVNADFVYNGVKLPIPTTADIAIKQGTLTVIDNNDDGKYDVIDIREYEDYIIRGRSGSLLLLNGRSYDKDQYSYFRAYNSSGEEVDDINRFAISAVVSVFESKDGKTYLEAVESLASDSGTVTEIRDEDGKTLFVTKNNKYFLSETFKKSIDDGVPGMEYPILGKAYVFKLNFENKIVAITQLYEGQWQIAYCVGIKLKRDEVTVELVMPDNSVFTPYFAQKVNINGNVVKSANISTDANIKKYFFDTNEQPIRQPVHIKISGDGEIKEIETPFDRLDSAYGYDKTIFSKDAYFSTGGYKSGSHHGIGMYTIRTNGTVIEDPYLDGTDRYRTDGVEIKAVGNVAEGQMTECYIYDLDESYVGDILVYKNNEESLEDSTTLALIDKVVTVYDEMADDLKGRNIHLFTQNGDELTLKEKKNGILPSDVKRGDVYKIAYSGTLLTAAEKLLSLADDPAPYASGTVVNQKWADIFGYVYSVCSDSVTVLKPDGYTATPQKLIGTALKGGATALVYDLPNDKVYVGSWEDMITSEVPDANGDITIDSHSTKVYIYRRWDYANGLVILKR